MAGTVKANLARSGRYRGIEKEQSLMSIIIKFQFLGRAERTGSPLCIGPKVFICALIALKSCSKRHLPDFFFITNIGVFQGEVEGSKCPSLICSFTKVLTACNFSEVSGHWGTHTESSVFQGIGRAAPVALRKNLGPFSVHCHLT